MRNFLELNINDGRGKPINRPPPSQELIKEFEAKYRIRLPEDYLSLLAFANGGGPELDSIRPSGEECADGWGINRFYFLNDEREAPENLWRETERSRPILGAHAVPFAEDGGGNQFFFDFKTVPAAIRVCIHDDNYKFVSVAPSFEAFIDSLEINPDYV